MQIQPAGRRNRKVTINRRSSTQPAGSVEFVISYTPDPPPGRFAAIEPLTSKELEIAQDSQVFSEATHKIWMLWWANAPTHQDQILFQMSPSAGGALRKFEILGEPIDPEMQHINLIFMVVERK